VEGVPKVFAVQNLITASPVCGNVSPGISYEFNEPVHRGDKVHGIPKEHNTSSNYAKSGDEPKVSNSDIVVCYNLGKLSAVVEGEKEECGNEEIGDNNLNLLLRVKSKHGLLLFVAGRFKDVVSSLTENKRSKSEIDGISVVIEKDGVAVQENGGRNKMEILVDEIGVRRFMIDLLLFHDIVNEVLKGGSIPWLSVLCHDENYEQRRRTE